MVKAKVCYERWYKKLFANLSLPVLLAQCSRADVVLDLYKWEENDGIPMHKLQEFVEGEARGHSQ
ncbi:hypothetical protein PR003_g12426 [Phytophthora rubi]|uniref:Uncharacterized protein n=1 Tax=Phytophthora rubi TaxID=129364 RepID=A0A6A4FIH5_9STRA|nr:hypothetical protein PF003_g16689 [Phytophthora fragariae]KAE9024523.1 hypothetical protein PR002_g11427 [Phytophthora rubi]KAE9336603.1 hypothetical protein PR003_g12426 [Phytophthora rubi]